MPFRRLSWVTLFLAAVACEGSPAQQSLIGTDPPSTCTPGQQVECACAGGAKGFQICAASGAAFEACACGGTDGTGLDGGSNGPGIDAESDSGTRADGAASTDAGVGADPDSGSTPSDSGSSGGDGSSAGDACTPTFDATLSVGAKYVLFVLDGSASMTGSKWESAKMAMAATFDGLERAARSDLAVGLVGFSDTLDTTHSAGPYPTNADVGLARVDAAQATKLRTRLTGTPDGSTPTKLALEGSHAALAAYVPVTPVPAGGRRVLVFLTDGNPNGGTTEETDVVSLVSARRLMSGTQTFAVGIEDTMFPFPAFLGSVASTTGASHHEGCSPTETTTAANVCFDLVRAPVDATSFDATLRRVVRRITDCEFPLPAGLPSSGFDVSLRSSTGTTRVTKGGANGWRYDDTLSPRSIVIDGTSCEALAAKTATAVVTAGCTTP
ncbi:MAG: vWA domain-containing protein [Polyangiaceae bacterium]